MTQPAGAAPSEGRRLLVVEDSPGDAELVQLAVAETGRHRFELRHAPSLRDGMALLAAGEFDVALLDLNLPDSAGEDTFQRLRVHRPELPIVVMTGAGDDEIGVELVRLGAQDYVDKSRLVSYPLASCLEYAIARKEIENALRHAEASAAAAAQAKSIFLSSMSHEIRTPLTAVLGMSELLLDTQLSEEQQSYVTSLQRCGKGLLAVLNNILELSRVESGEVELAHKSFELRELVEDVANVFAFAAEKKKLSLCADIGFDVPDCVVGDPERIQQILTNLVANALKFTPAGFVLLRVTCAANDGSRAALRFEVRDSGIGMTPEEARAIFDRFAQGNPQVARKFGGSGLGLAICKELVELMQGTIAVESRPRKGSCFTIDLTFEVGPPGQGPRPEVDLAGRRILLADDAEVERGVVAGWLRHWGAIVREAESLEEAQAVLEAARGEQPFDVAILDARMPGKGGLDLAKSLPPALRGDLHMVVLLPVAHRGSDLGRCRKSDVTPVIKPVRAAALAAALRQGPLPPAESGGRAETRPHDEVEARGTRILLVDDAPENRAILLAFLKKLGCEIETAENGAAAVERVQSAAFDLILMDMQMPVLDGYEATRAIRRLEAAGSVRRTPIVALTAYAFKEQARACLEAGCDGHLAKPVERHVLYEAVRRYARPARILVRPDPDIADLVPGYLENRSADVAVLREAIAASTFETVARLGHNMKGSGAGYGLPAISELGTAIEQAGQAADARAAAEAVDRLEAFLARVELALD